MAEEAINPEQNLAKSRLDKMTSTSPIVFDYQGKTYTLEFNRFTYRTAVETYHCDLDKLSKDHEVSTFPDLFYCAFLMHHSGISRKKVDEIYATMQDKVALYTRLIVLFAAPIQSMFEEPEEGNATCWM